MYWRGFFKHLFLGLLRTGKIQIILPLNEHSIFDKVSFQYKQNITYSFIDFIAVTDVNHSIIPNFICNGTVNCANYVNLAGLWQTSTLPCNSRLRHMWYNLRYLELQIRYTENTKTYGKGMKVMMKSSIWSEGDGGSYPKYEASLE